MATFKTTYEVIKKDNNTINIVKKNDFESFNEKILGLGEIENKSKQINALSVIFDLEGFTNFCKQIDPQLAVPEYLSEFLKWIFSQIKQELTEKVHKEGYETWADLPFLSKYLGDGILFLWNTDNMNDDSITNVVVSMYEICNNYLTQFFPKISKNVSLPPPKLRCGIARGAIYSVGNGSDFVGPCINMSARLQKLHSLTFCFSRRGINPSEMSDFYKNEFIIKKVNIRGIGTDELVCCIKNEFNRLNKEDKDKFQDI